MKAALLQTFNYFSKRTRNGLEAYVFYKIVDQPSGYYYVIQCINTQGIIYETLDNIVKDKQLILGLHPIQTCYLGIEYAHNIGTNKTIALNENHEILHRYGSCELIYETQERLVCIKNHITANTEIVDPRDLSLDNSAISQFDSTEAFHIGLLAAQKCTLNSIKPKRKPILKLVKS